MINSDGLVDAGSFNGFAPELAAVEQLMEVFGVEDFVIAGGFVRDALTARDFKDIDVFIPGEQETCIDEEIIYELCATIDVNVSGFHINVIRLGWKFSSVKEVLDRMDTGICQAALAMDRSAGMFTEYRVVHTEAFATDIADKTITVIRPELQARGDHLDRLQVKYQDHLLNFK